MLKKTVAITISILGISSASAKDLNLEKIGKDIINNKSKDQIVKKIDSNIHKSSLKINNNDVSICVNAWNKAAQNAIALTSADIGSQDSGLFPKLYSEDNYDKRRSERVAIMGIVFMKEHVQLCKLDPSYYYQIIEAANYKMINHYYQFDNSIFDLNEQTQAPSSYKLNNMINLSK